MILLAAVHITHIIAPGFQRKGADKSLEELAIIIEVLEEDLRAGNSFRSPSQSLSSAHPPVSPEGSPTGKSYRPFLYLLPNPIKYVTYCSHFLCFNLQGTLVTILMR